MCTAETRGKPDLPLDMIIIMQKLVSKIRLGDILEPKSKHIKYFLEKKNTYFDLPY